MSASGAIRASASVGSDVPTSTGATPCEIKMSVHDPLWQPPHNLPVVAKAPPCRSITELVLITPFPLLLVSLWCARGVLRRRKFLVLRRLSARSSTDTAQTRPLR